MAENPSIVERRLLLGGLAGALGMAAFARGASAGPLTPPAGPVAPTPGPEPRTIINATNTPGSAASVFVISQPGSYVLTENLTIPAARNGIEIAASGVTVDLNGFALTGGTNGVATSATTVERITIRNGVIANSSSRGINCTSNVGVVVENVTVSGTGFSGIQTGDSARVSACTVVGGGAASTSGTSGGIQCGKFSVVKECVVRGYVGGSGSASGGIVAQEESTIVDSTVTGSTYAGFSLRANCTVQGCAADGNLYGFFADSGSVLYGCVASNNSSRGFSLNPAIAVNCCARANPLFGFVCSSDSVIKDCAVYGPSTAGTSTGILMSSGGVATGNRVSGCNVGYSVASSGAFLAGNTATGAATSNWSVAAGNSCQVVSAVTGGAFTGNAGGVSPGSTSPWVNFTI